MLKHDLSAENIKKGLKNPRQAFDKTVAEVAVRAPLTFLNTISSIGTSVYDREWDVLILLDTCRVDALREVALEYDFVKNIGSIWSIGGRSPEWIAKTFSKQHESEIRNTAYLSANVFSKKILEDQHHKSATRRDVNSAYALLGRIPTVNASSLGRFEYLYEYEPVGVDGPLGHKDGGTPPRYVTDRGIAVNRKYDFDRLILHYLQPHPPYVANAIHEERELKQHERDWWSYLGETGDYDTIWNTYLDELRYVLNDVELLLDNMNAETVVISADHGEAFGEYWEYGHHTGSVNPYIRKVPWVVTTATDQDTYTPTTELPSGKTSIQSTTEDQLEALGYKL